eukprot:CAMPEP_0173206150 /NCGR_PEP_ID=MMETSP1141-20130122/21172_1 /TAXON_ID=483371 /ORGANISM="non described non described, Strain CCMP2298" /LENGTH=123 /DNA_ID=CAMNT_0014132201 /DNA_START=19 /DNA_END=386 /DNA_ORIENTATION=+
MSAMESKENRRSRDLSNANGLRSISMPDVKEKDFHPEVSSEPKRLEINSQPQDFVVLGGQPLRVRRTGTLASSQSGPLSTLASLKVDASADSEAYSEVVSLSPLRPDAGKTRDGDRADRADRA